MTASAVATAILGWVILTVVARRTGPDGYATFSAVWGLYFAITTVLVGLQQEVTRSLMSVDAQSSRPVLPGVLGLGGGLAVLTLCTSPWWAGSLEGTATLSTGGAMAAGVLAVTLMLLVNGTLAARGSWHSLAVMTLLEQVVRLAAVGLALLLTSHPSSTVMTLAVAAGAVSFVLAPLVERRPGLLAGRVSGGLVAFSGRTAAAMISTGCAGLLVVGLPFLVTITNEDPDVALGVVFAAILLTRSPLLVPLTALRPLLVNLLVRHRGDLGRTALRGLPFALAGGAVVVVGAYVLGPWVLRLAFGDAFTVDRSLMGWLAVAALLLVAMTLTGIALVVLDHDLTSAAGWLLATIVATVVLCTPLALESRVVAALVAGPLAGMALHMVAALRGQRRVPARA